MIDGKNGAFPCAEPHFRCIFVLFELEIMAAAFLGFGARKALKKGGAAKRSLIQET